MDDVPGGKLRGMRFQQNLFYIMDLSLAIYQVQISALTVLSLLAKFKPFREKRGKYLMMMCFILFFTEDKPILDVRSVLYLYPAKKNVFCPQVAIIYAVLFCPPSLLSLIIISFHQD